MVHTQRRQFLIAAGGLLVAPIASHAQAPQHARVGLLSAASSSTYANPSPLVPRLRELGWIEGRNLTLDRRFADGREERLPELASQLVQLGVQVIVAQTDVEVHAARSATHSISIVTLYLVGDPIKMGLAQSLSHPSSNVTGVMWPGPTFTAKSVQILKETLPSMRKLGFLYPAGIPDYQKYIDAANAAARALGVRTYWYPIARPEDVPTALVAIKKERVDVLRISSAVGTLWDSAPQITDFAASNRIPTSWNSSVLVERGGFMSYTPNVSDIFTRAAAFVDKLLKGANPADLPFEFPTRYELVINRKTAAQLGITLPQTILQFADRIIE